MPIETAKVEEAAAQALCSCSQMNSYTCQEHEDGQHNCQHCQPVWGALPAALAIASIALAAQSAQRVLRGVPHVSLAAAAFRIIVTAVIAEAPLAATSVLLPRASLRGVSIAKDRAKTRRGCCAAVVLAPKAAPSGDVRTARAGQPVRTGCTGPDVNAVAFKAEVTLWAGLRLGSVWVYMAQFNETNAA